MQVEKTHLRINWLVPVAVIGVVGILGFLIGMRGDPLVYAILVGVSGGISLLASMPLWIVKDIEIPDKEK